MPANETSVNLLGDRVAANSPWNRMMDWIVTYGRYIMIGTELIVLAAFLSRFSLDRKLTDLKENITQKQEVLEANATLEKDIIAVQKKLAIIKTLISDQAKPLTALQSLQDIVPSGIYLDNLTIEKGKITADVSTDVIGSLSQFFTNLSETKSFTDIEIGTITRQKNNVKLKFAAKYDTIKK